MRIKSSLWKTEKVSLLRKDRPFVKLVKFPSKKRELGNVTAQLPVELNPITQHSGELN